MPKNTELLNKYNLGAAIKQVRSYQSVTYLLLNLIILNGCKCGGSGFVWEERTDYVLDSKGSFVKVTTIVSVPCNNCTIK